MLRERNKSDEFPALGNQQEQSKRPGEWGHFGESQFPPEPGGFAWLLLEMLQLTLSSKSERESLPESKLERRSEALC